MNVVWSHTAHKSRKQEMSKMALSKVPPTAEESAVLHELMLDQSTSKRDGDGGKVIERVDMSETVVCPVPRCFLDSFRPRSDCDFGDLQTSADFLMHPQERNLHGQVFGGEFEALTLSLLQYDADRS